MRLDRYIDHLLAENAAQNLIGRDTIGDVIDRHIADSLQLLPHLQDGVIADVGSGAGFPGLVLACATSRPVVLIEPRSKRAAFLQTVVGELGLADRVAVEAIKCERLSRTFANITARAVAPLDRLFAVTETIANSTTRWILPKGRKAREELAVARQTWQGEFDLVQSVTDPEASILVARRVRRRQA